MKKRRNYSKIDVNVEVDDNDFTYVYILFSLSLLHHFSATSTSLGINNFMLEYAYNKTNYPLLNYYRNHVIIAMFV